MHTIDIDAEIPPKHRFSAPVRRGLAALLAYIREDHDSPPWDKAHPLGRRLDAASRGAVQRAYEWAEHHAAVQLHADAANRQPPKGGE